ncbi:Tuberous sclerosis 2-like protein [Oleoguttula sp. CCFEE 5521]
MEEDKDAHVNSEWRPTSSLSSQGLASIATSSLYAPIATTTEHANAVFSLGSAAGVLEISPFEAEVCDRLIRAVQNDVSLSPVLRQAKEVIQRHAKWITQAGLRSLLEAVLSRAVDSTSTTDLYTGLDFVDTIGIFAAVPHESLLCVTRFVAYSYHQGSRMNKHRGLAEKAWSVFRHGVQSHSGQGCITALLSSLRSAGHAGTKKEYAVTSGALQLVQERLVLSDAVEPGLPSVSVFALLPLLRRLMCHGDEAIREQVLGVMQRLLTDELATTEVGKSASWRTCVEIVSLAPFTDDNPTAHTLLDLLTQNAEHLDDSDLRGLAHLTARAQHPVTTAMTAALIKQFRLAIDEGIREGEMPEEVYTLFQYQSSELQKRLVEALDEKLVYPYSPDDATLRNFILCFTDRIATEETTVEAAVAMTTALSTLTYAAIARSGDVLDGTRKINSLIDAMARIANTAVAPSAKLRALRTLARLRAATDGAIYMVADEAAGKLESAASQPDNVKAADLSLHAWLLYVLAVIEMDPKFPAKDDHCVRFVLSSFPEQLSNHTLFYRQEHTVKRCFELVSARLNDGKAEHAAAYVKILTTLISYRAEFGTSEHKQLIRALLKTAGSSDTVSIACIHALTICCYEMPDTTSIFMDEILQKMHRMVTQRHLAIHVLEFLSGLSRLEALYKHSFRFEDFKRIFGVSFSYLDSLRNKASDGRTQLSDQASSSDSESQQTMSQYVHALAYHTIVFWYLATRLEHRAAIKEYVTSRLVYKDVDGVEVLEDQGLVTIDLMDSVDAEVAQDASDATVATIQYGKSKQHLTKPLLCFDPEDGTPHVQTRIFGLLIITTHTSFRTGKSVVTTRRPSGTFRSLHQRTTAGSRKDLHDSKIETTLHSQLGHHEGDLLVPIYPGDEVGKVYGSYTVPDVTSPLGSGEVIDLPEEEATARAIDVFDRTPGLDSHKAGVIYIGEGQTTEEKVFLNSSGSPDYREFVKSLGKLQELKDAAFNSQGLDIQTGTDGLTAIVWNSEVTELVYHVTTMMPYHENDDDATAIAKKKRHTGNDHVNIVFNNSGAPFVFNMFPSAFNYVYVVITPSVRTTFLQSRTHTMKTPVGERYYRVEVLTAPGFPSISSAAEAKLVSGSSLPDYVRNLALNACIFSEVWMNRDDESYRSSWRLRLNQIKQLRASPDATIYAVSTAPGRAAIAIIRVSGPGCLPIYRQLCPEKAAPRPRQATVRTLYEPGSPETSEHVLDSSALVLYFPAPKTVTGEDILELHVHGGTAVVKAVLAAVSRCTVLTGTTIRYAEPGEFTRRAFLNDRLDLTQVEALGDVLSATTEQQRRLSVRGTSGALAERYEEWRQQLLYARGELEALIDFSEDQHFDESISELLQSVSAQVDVLKAGLRAHRDSAVKGELLRNGISLALLGAPNAGKSSLLNRIVGREAAIVSEEAGTTRDVVEISIDLGGYLCRLGDTAGLRRRSAALADPGSVSQDIGAVEREGMKRAKARAGESDVVIVVLDFKATSDGHTAVHFDNEVMETAIRLIQAGRGILVVINKLDLATDEAAAELAITDTLYALPGLQRNQIHMLSCVDDGPTLRTESGAGPTNRNTVQSFLRGLISTFETLTSATSPDGDQSDPSAWQESLGATERHRLLLDECVEHLDLYTELVSEDVGERNGDDGDDGGDGDVVLAAEHLRGAANALAKITGKGEAGDVEDVLGVVFEKFCVGK